jgi:PAS domain S-box-containing protein
MTRWKKAIVLIEKNGLVLIAIVIILFYWVIDIITDGRMVSRLLITFSMSAYGIFTQYLINAQKVAKDSLRDSEEQHRLMIETLPLAVFVESFGKIIYVNPAFLTLFKVSSPDAIIGTRLIKLVHPGLIDIIERRRRIMIQEKSILPPLEINLQCMDGSFITVVSTSMPIIFQKQPSILSVLYDITGRKLTDIELQKAHKLLQIQTREIEDLRAELKKRVIPNP